MLEEVVFIFGIIGILIYFMSFASALEIVSDVYSVDAFSIGQVTEDVVDSDYDSRYVLPLDSGAYFDSDLVYGEAKNLQEEVVVEDIETPSISGGGGGGGSGGGGGGGTVPLPELQCYTNDDCDSGYSCLDDVCVKVYDLAILDFESPGRLSENFDFRYYIKRLTQKRGDVKMTYWMQDKNGNIVGYGTGSIFLEEDADETNVGQFILNDKVRTGDSIFYVRADDDNVTLIDYVPVSLKVEGDFVYINKKVNWPILIAISFIFIISSILIIAFNDKFIALWYWFKRRYYDNWKYRIREVYWRIMYGRN